MFDYGGRVLGQTLDEVWEEQGHVHGMARVASNCGPTGLSRGPTR